MYFWTDKDRHEQPLRLTRRGRIVLYTLGFAAAIAIGLIDTSWLVGWWR